MRVHKITNLVIIILLISIIIYCLLMNNSLSRALENAGLNSRGIRYIEDIDVDPNGDRISIIHTYLNSGQVALVRVRQNALGFWVVEEVSTCTDGVTMARLRWQKSAGISRFTPSAAGSFETEYHFVYAGNNAKNLISMYPSMLPENCTANVQQSGSLYVIHIICFDTSYPQIDMKEILLYHDLIEE